MFTRPPPVETGFHLLCHLQQLEAHAGPIKPEEEGEELALKEEGEEVLALEEGVLADRRTDCSPGRNPDSRRLDSHTRLAVGIQPHTGPILP